MSSNFNDWFLNCIIKLTELDNQKDKQIQQLLSDNEDLQRELLETEIQLKKFEDIMLVVSITISTRIFVFIFGKITSYIF